MRLVQVTVPDEKQAAVMDVLEGEGIDYVLTDTPEDPDYAATIFFPLPTEAVESVLHALNERNLGEVGHSVIVNAETVVSTDFEELQEEYETTDEQDDQVAAEELGGQARESIPSRGTYALLTAVSAVVATAGMLINSPAVVVGAMVIAPLVGPAMATSVGTVLYDQRLFHHGVKHQLFGVVLALVSATLFAAVAKNLFLVPPGVVVVQIEQVAGRLSPDLLTLVVAVGAGIAGARSLSSDIATGLVGVMIAAALVPPAAAVGIGVAWWLPGVVFDAGVLVLVNVLAINLAALGTLWYSGYRPPDWDSEARARSATRRRLLTLGVAVLVLTTVLLAFTVSAYRTADASQAVRSDVNVVLDDPRYDQLTVVGTRIDYEAGMKLVDPDPSRVVVRVTRPNGDEYPELAERIDRRIERRTGSEVLVQVRYVSVDSSG